MLAKGSELPGWFIAAVPVFGVAVYAFMSWLTNRDITAYYPRERRVRYRGIDPAGLAAWRAERSAYGLDGRVTPLRGTIRRPVAGSIERRGWHPAGSALVAMPPKTALSPEYGAYIASPEWRARSRAFLMANPRCQLRHPGCTRRATQAHHRDYSELFHETARTLQAVCATCHATEEWAKTRARR